ncbi:hypothetical protein FBEOM_5224 [Fusarium beomiforme]|uniref:Ceramide glucosyltransferase n=1 Tax=Fusarium beomiforme TaxID=44412 RepID=A0A9P5ALW6_9HYPO|nr:hypothetical protein FBEOM_5224 [Fusarium beomiforme]
MAESPKINSPGAIISLAVLGIIIFLRLLRFAVLQLGLTKYRAPSGPANLERDCSVILTIRDPNDTNLISCVRSILVNNPKQLHVITDGTKAQHRVDAKIDQLRVRYPNTQVSVGAVNEPKRRREIAHALHSVNTDLTVITDQGVHWHAGFLSTALIPFKDDRVGCVTVPKIARKSDGIWGSLLRRDSYSSLKLIPEDTPQTTVQVDAQSPGYDQKKERKQYPYAFGLTYLSSFISFTLIYEIIVVLLVYVNGLLSKDWIAWLVLGLLLLVLQLFVGLQVAQRVRHSGSGVNNSTILMAILFGISAQCELEILALPGVMLEELRKLEESWTNPHGSQDPWK